MNCEQFSGYANICICESELRIVFATNTESRERNRDVTSAHKATESARIVRFRETFALFTRSRPVGYLRRNSVFIPPQRTTKTLEYSRDFTKSTLNTQFASRTQQVTDTTLRHIESVVTSEKDYSGRQHGPYTTPTTY